MRIQHGAVQPIAQRAACRIEHDTAGFLKMCQAMKDKGTPAGFALGNAAIIAVYTLIDGAGI